MANDTLKYAGEVSIDKVEIISQNGTGVDISNQLVSIELSEDLYSPFFHGTVIIYESQDLVNLFPLVGDEVINLEFHTPGVEQKWYRKQQYWIYKMGAYTEMSDKSAAYVLHFCSKEAIVDLNTKLSRSYGGKISDLVKTIATDTYALASKKEVRVEETGNEVKFIANYWTPVKCINFIGSGAVSVKGHPTYLFYENALGLNFFSYGILCSEETSWEFTQGQFQRKPDGTRDIALEYRTIIDMDIPESFDYIDRSSSGMYANFMITVDPITKKYTGTSYNALDDFGTYTHLNKFSGISNNAIYRSEQSMIYVPKHYGNFNGFIDNTNAQNQQQRNSILKQMELTKIEITVHGRTDYTVGQVVNMIIPSKQPYDAQTDPKNDNMFSGKYIISAIMHTITAEKHECTMELIKDSMITDINKVTR